MQAPYPSHKNKWQKEVEEKRGTQRLKHGDAAKMFNLDKIKVNIITGQRSYTSILLSNSHFGPLGAIANGIEGFIRSIGGCVTHVRSVFSARRAQTPCFFGPLAHF